MSDYVIEAIKVVKSFPSGTTKIDVLQETSFHLEEGKSASIRGESGSGKSTFLNIIAGLESIDAGSVLWQGKEVSAVSNRKIAHRRGVFLSMIFQSYMLFPELNALENVLMPARVIGRPLDEAKARAHELLTRVGLSHRLKSMPTTLSGGERQRVAVARALINQPPLVLADEPTGNLDEKSSEDVIALLIHLTQEEGASLVLVTHSRVHAQRTDRQWTMQSGKLIELE